MDKDLEYETCRRRGHEAALAGWSDNLHTWSVCKWCGIDYRTETTINVIERNLENLHDL